MITTLTGVNFNCTIQELKHSLPACSIVCRTYFNCTIQELKLRALVVVQDLDHLFQLHHTGIKTA